MTQKRNRTRHDFLHTFFSKKEGYQILEVNGYFLVNQWNAGSNQWEVAIFAPEAFKKMQEWKKGIESRGNSPTPTA